MVSLSSHLECGLAGRCFRSVDSWWRSELLRLRRAPALHIIEVGRSRGKSGEYLIKAEPCVLLCSQRRTIPGLIVGYLGKRVERWSWSRDVTAGVAARRSDGAGCGCWCTS